MIINNRRKPVAPGYHEEKPFHYSLDSLGNFSPRTLPKSGSLVALEKPNSPPANIVISERDWRVDGIIAPMSNILLSIQGVLYTYQIQLSDRPGYGTLVLISKRITESQPGSKTRTAKGGGGIASYSR